MTRARQQLVDFDSAIPNLALMKLAAYHKARGRSVSLTKVKWSRDVPSIPLEFFEPADEVWLSCLFTWHREQAQRVVHPSAKMHYGGTGFDWGKPRDQRTELPSSIERLNPDYGLYNDDRAVGFCQRGCNRKCQFCDVWRKEGRIRDNPYRRITRWVPDEFNKVLLLDNDMALYDDKTHDEILYDCRSTGRKLSITQGYDIRCMTPERAAQLAEAKPWNTNFTAKSLYIAWDYLGIEGWVRKGIEMLKDSGFRGAEIVCYMICGFNTTMEEDFYRYRVLWNEYGVYPFVMIYNNRKDDPKLRAFANWVNRRYHKNVPWEEFDRNPERQQYRVEDQVELEGLLRE